MSSGADNLLSGRLLGRNVLWNLLGFGAPLIIALFAVPMLIDGMGTERFGLLAIIWMGIGYFSLFDMGLGRALTKLVAERLGRADTGDIRELIWTALALVLLLGLVGMILVLIASSWLVTTVFNVEQALQSEARTALRVLALGIPLVILTSALVGIVEAHQRFASIAAIRAPLGALSFLGPLITVQFTPDLAAATAVLLGARVLALCAFFVIATRATPELLQPAPPQRALARSLLSFGGWLTVSNIVGPLMVYFDRILIGAMMTMTAVTYYVTPYEVLSRLRIVPQSVMGVLFPALATAYTSDRQRLVKLYGQASRLLFFVMLPPVAVIFLLAPEGLTLWVGPEFRQMSTGVVQWLAVGVLVNALARAPLVALQGAGRPDIVARVHLLEFVPYAVLLWVLIMQYGIVGAAAAWTLRVVVDAVILLILAARAVMELRAVVRRTLVLVPALAGVFALAALVEPLLPRVLIAGGACVVSATVILLTARRLLDGRDAMSPVAAPSREQR